MATDCSDATHFVADRFARTKKMLEAMGLGKQIVTPLWLESCDQVGCIIDEKNYILRDAKKEKQHVCFIVSDNNNTSTSNGNWTLILNCNNYSILHD